MSKVMYCLIGGSPTLSMLLELPPRGHGEPLPQLPVLVQTPVSEPLKTDDDLAKESSETSTSESNLVPQPFVRSIPTIDNENSQPEEPVVPGMLCFIAKLRTRPEPDTLTNQSVMIIYL